MKILFLSSLIVFGECHQSSTKNFKRFSNIIDPLLSAVWVQAETSERAIIPASKRTYAEFIRVKRVDDP